LRVFLIGRRGGIIYSIVVGIVGRCWGGFLVSLFGHARCDRMELAEFPVAIAGAVVLLLILGFVAGEAGFTGAAGSVTGECVRVPRGRRASCQESGESEVRDGHG